MPRAVYWVSVEGVGDISSVLEPVLISLEITDSGGGESDSLTIEIDDEGGDTILPPTNASIQAGIMYENEDGSPVGPPVQFSGKVSKPTSTFGRGQGLTLRITAESADVKGKPKEHQEQHHDKGKLSAVAKKFGESANLKVKVPQKVDFEREYWTMAGESFLNWGSRIARENGLTFKVRGGEAVFAERSAGVDMSGQSLPPVYATYGENIISGTMSPIDDRESWDKFRTRYYDPKQAKYVYTDVDVQERKGNASHTNRLTSTNKDAAERRAKSNKTESEREQGGGTVVINGEPTAQAEATCILQVRPGISGTYRIASARHKLSRKEGYTTELELKQPAGEAGKDTRKSGTSSSGSSGSSGSRGGSGGSGGTPVGFTNPDF